MGEISLNREDAMRVLNNPESSPGARVIAGCTVAFFESVNGVDEACPQTRAICQKLLRMAGAALDGEG